MKTFKSQLNKFNIEELVNAYVKKYPRDYRIFISNYNQMISNEVKKKYRKKVKQFIEQIKKLEIQRLHKDEKLIAFAHEKNPFIRDFTAIFTICKINDLKMMKDDAKNYKLEFKKCKEVMGIFIAETQFTKSYIIELIIYILHRLIRSKMSQKYHRIASRKTKNVKDNRQCAYNKLLYRGGATERWYRIVAKRKEIRKILKTV